MFSNKNKEKGKKGGIVSSIEETHSVSQITQNLTVRTTTRSQSISYVRPMESPTGSLLSLPSLGNNFMPPPDTKRPKSSSSYSNLKKIDVDATPIVPPPVNPNYQSPYRNSPVYKSFTGRKYTPFTAYKKSAEYPTVNIKVPSPSKNPPAKKLIVKKTGILYDNDGRLPTYKTSSKTRGEVLIINNIMFKGELERKGAKADDENLQNLFKQMGFKVSLKRDLKKKDLESSVENFSKKLAKSSDISVVIVMSHGTTNDVWRGTEVFGVDEKGVLTEDLLQYFSGDKCKNMLNKPKIFIFQCCRGDNEQFIQSDARPVKRQSRPIGDMLIAYSTLPGFVSYRNPESGTWYIQTLCEVFSKHAHEYHVEELLKIVDLELNRFTSSVAQTSSYENRGFKRCYLHPI